VKEKEAAMRTISYKDPTGETAVGNILREERRRERQRLRAANRDSSEDTEKESPEGLFPKTGRAPFRQGA
jgi:hypothetical protein